MGVLCVQGSYKYHTKSRNEELHVVSLKQSDIPRTVPKEKSSCYTLLQTSAMFTSHFTIPGSNHVLGHVSTDYINKE